MKPHEQSQALLNQQASEWVEILKGGRKEDYDAFMQWLTESPRHVRDYMLMETLDAELAQLDTAALRELRITESAAQGVIALPQRFTAAPASNRKVRTLRRKFWIAGVAATLLLIVGAGWLVQQRLGWTEFHTARGTELPAVRRAPVLIVVVPGVLLLHPQDLDRDLARPGHGPAAPPDDRPPEGQGLACAGLGVWV